MFLNIVLVFCSLLCLVRFLSDSDWDCLEAACIPANLNSAGECSRSRGRISKHENTSLANAACLGPLLPVAYRISIFEQRRLLQNTSTVSRVRKVPLSVFPVAFKKREKCFCDGHHVSNSLQVKGYVHLHCLFGSKLALDPEGSARANTIHNGKTIKNDRICSKMQSRHVNWKKFNATLPSSASKLWFRNISTQHLDLCPESLPLVLARLTQD